MFCKEREKLIARASEQVKCMTQRHVCMDVRTMCSRCPNWRVAATARSPVWMTMTTHDVDENDNNNDGLMLMDVDVSEIISKPDGRTRVVMV